MKDATRTRLSELILEELAEKLRKHEGMRRKLEAFTDLPVERVADTVLRQFEYLLSSDLRDLIIHLIEEELMQEQASAQASEMMEESALAEEVSAPPPPEPEPAPPPPVVTEAPRAPAVPPIERFGPREPFRTAPLDVEMRPTDWLYLVAFSYAPDSTGKGVPVKKLLMKGIDKANDIILLDFGDLRFYIQKLSTTVYSIDKNDNPTQTTNQSSRTKLEHETILNTLRSEEVLLGFPHWTLVRGRELLIKQLEEQYVDLLQALIDVHDAVEWNVEVYASDHHILRLPSVADSAKNRVVRRETRHGSQPRRDDALMEKVIFREKSLAQDIHNRLLLIAAKTRVDFMIRLDNAFMEDWKSILSVRYTVPKDKRKQFCQAVKVIQEEMAEYELMLRIANPTVRFTFRG